VPPHKQIPKQTSYENALDNPLTCPTQRHSCIVNTSSRTGHQHATMYFQAVQEERRGKKVYVKGGHWGSQNNHPQPAMPWPGMQATHPHKLQRNEYVVSGRKMHPSPVSPCKCSELVNIWIQYAGAHRNRYGQNYRSYPFELLRRCCDGAGFHMRTFISSPAEAKTLGSVGCHATELTQP
jgi:hypothetical protein